MFNLGGIVGLSRKNTLSFGRKNSLIGTEMGKLFDTKKMYYF